MIDVTTPILRPGTDKESYLASAGAVRESLHDAGIVPHLHEGLVRYLLDGIRPGDFLQAVLNNDLAQAILRYSGDLNDLKPLLLWILNCTPSPCSGGSQAVDKWVAWKTDDRMKGLEI